MSPTLSWVILVGLVTLTLIGVFALVRANDPLGEDDDDTYEDQA